MIVINKEEFIKHLIYVYNYQKCIIYLSKETVEEHLNLDKNYYGNYEYFLSNSKKLIDKFYIEKSMPPKKAHCPRSAP